MATIEKIPTSTLSTDSHYEQRISLDGQDFIFTFQYNQREEKWYFDLADQNEEQIVSGLKIVPGLDFLRCVTDLRKPPGVLVAIDLPATGQTLQPSFDPKITELGDRVRLYYIGELVT